MANLYCTTSALSTLMIGTSFDSVTTSLANQIIPMAQNKINKYLSKRYDLSADTFQTTVSIPPLVRSLCEELSEGMMYLRMSRGGKESLTRGKELINMAMQCLEEIADYELDLADTSGSIIDDFSNTAYSVLSNTDDYTPTFAEDDPLNWVVDPDKLDDIESDRD